MTVQTSQSTESCNGQKKLNLAEQLREALSDWIIGKVSLDETGIKCEQLVRRAMDEAGICDNCPSPDSITRINLAADDDERAVKIRMVALECIAFAAIQRALRKSRFDDSAEFMDYFRLELYGDWTGLVATSKGIAGLILDVDRDDNTDYDEDDREFLKTLFKPFWHSLQRHKRQRTRLEIENRTYNRNNLLLYPVKTPASYRRHPGLPVCHEQREGGA